MTFEEAEVFLMTDGDLRVPCSRYGRCTSDCAPWAWLLYRIMVANGSDEGYDALDHDMGLVVNDHDDVLYMVFSYWSDLPEADQERFDGIFSDAEEMWAADDDLRERSGAE